MPNVLENQARDQVILPIGVAFEICMRGIKTRLGRSVVTLLGVSFGIAFLMSVLAGVHIKQAMSRQAEIDRDVDQRVAVLRAEVGVLKGKRFLALGERLSPVDLAFLRALADRHGAVVMTSKNAGGNPEGSIDAAVYMDADRNPPAPGSLAALTGRRLLSFVPVPRETIDSGKSAGVEIKPISLELGQEELKRAARQAEQARQRTYWIVGISMLITLIGITNAMLMSVTERFREIGTMKCLGALSTFVVKLFLVETSLIGAAGSLLGAVIGLLFALAGYSYTFGIGSVLSSVSYGTLGLTVLICVGIGVILSVIAGIYPARVAAKMRPAAALASNV